MSLNTPNDEHPSFRDPLDVVAEKIMTLWKESDDKRTAAALLLKQAKERIESGEDERFSTFNDFCHELLPGRTERDIRRLLQIAYAPDPAEECGRQRRVARESMARTRARRKEDQRWSAASVDELVDSRAGDGGNGSIECVESGFEPDAGDDISFEQEVERCVAFFEQNSGRIAQLPSESRVRFLQRLQHALSLFPEAA